MSGSELFDLVVRIVQWTVIPLGGLLVWFAKRLVDSNDDAIKELKQEQAEMKKSRKVSHREIREDIDVVERESLQGLAAVHKRVDALRSDMDVKLSEKVGRAEAQATIQRIDESLDVQAKSVQRIEESLGRLSEYLMGQQRPAQPGQGNTSHD